MLIRPKNGKQFEARGMGPFVGLEGQVRAANKGRVRDLEDQHRDEKHVRQVIKVGVPEHAMEFGLRCPHGTLCQVSPTLHEDIRMAF